MKFLHLADLHLGRTMNEISLIPDQAYMLRQVLDLAEKEQIDAVLIAGDVYDRAVPPEEAVALLDEFLSSLSAMNLPAFIISGNHDSDERLNFGSRLFQKNGIYICGKYDGTLHEVTLQDAYGPVHIWLMPYIQRAMVQHFWPDDDTKTYESAARCVLAHAQINPKERNVLLAHQFVTAGKAENDPQLSGSETTAKNVGTIDRIACCLFDDFDYVALGHIHRPQRVGRDCVRYGGSPLKYSLSEVNQEKAYTIIRLEEKEKLPEISLIPVSPLHEVRQLKGRLSELLKPENIEYPDDYIFVTLTDETPVPDAFSAIQSRYPNACGLRYDMSRRIHAEEASTDGAQEKPEKKGFDEQIQDFYRRILGTSPSDEEMKILRDAAKAAGVED